MSAFTHITASTFSNEWMKDKKYEYLDRKLSFDNNLFERF